MPPSPLPFEQDIQQMEELLRRMEEGSSDGSTSEEIRRIRRELTNLIRKKYSELEPWETVQVARHPNRLPTPIICVVIGEGGSGGALGIGVGDRVSMLEFAYYSVISPEGCAGILWKVADDKTKPRAATALRLTSRDLFRMRVIDDIIPE